MGNNFGSEGRKDLHLYDPNKLLIVTDPANVLCQEIRNKTPTPKWLVNSILRNGVTTPIKCRRGAKVDGEYQMEIVVGRQRVKAAREANKILVKQGKDPVTIKVESVVGDDAYMLFLMQSENSERVEMSALEKAETAAMAINRGTPEQKVITDSFRGIRADYDRHMALLNCHADVIAAVEDGRVSIKAIDTFTALSREKQQAVLTKMEADGKTGPREAKDIAATHEDTLQNNGTGRPGAEPKTRTKNEGPKSRNAGEMMARLAALESLPEPNEDDEGADAELVWAIRSARIEELRWALRDDDALATVSKNDLGGWVNTKAEKAAESAAKKEAEKAEKAAAKERAKADKAAEREAAKQQAKADKIAAREQAKQEAKDAKEAEKARMQAEKEAAAAKRAAKKQSKASAAKQVTIAAVAPAVAPKVPARKGAQGRGKGRGRK